MSTFIPPTPAATKSAEQHEEPSEQDSFNNLLYQVLRFTSEQVQDLNDWMIHQGIPNVHEIIVQGFRRPQILEDDLHFIRENKTCYIKTHVMTSLSLMIAYIKHLRRSDKATHFGPFYYIQIDPQDYDEWRIETAEEDIHFQTPSKLGSPATPRSMATSQTSDSYITLTNFKKGIKRDASAYPILKNERYYNTFIRHFKATAKAQGLNTLMDPNFTPGSDEYEQQLFQEQQDFLYSVLISSLKTDFSEALVKDHEGDAQLKDQQQMIIDHNRSLPKSGSSSLSTPNKSPSPLPHKPTPQQTVKSQQVHTHQSDQSTADTTKVETTPSDPLLAMVHQSIHTSADDASDITKVLSAKRSRQIQVCKHYIFQHANHTNNQLVDRGANGGLAGSDMRVIYKTHRKINISGIDNHEVTGLDVVTAATLLNTSLGKVIGIFNEYAYLGKGSSIHSSGQLEWFKTLVDEKSIKVGGTQLITTLDGYSIPLLIRDGLAYATSLGRPTDQDMDTYPHVFFTSPDEWDLSVLDHDPPHLDGLNPSQVSDQHFGDPMFDAYGDFNERIIANLNILLDSPPRDCGSHTALSSVSTVNLHQSSPQEPDWDALRPFFAWTSPSSIKDTFNVTTRHGTAPHTQDYIKKHFKSRNPVFNIPRRSEAVATDTIFSDTPAVDDGSTMAQFFCGRDTLVCDAYGIKSTKQFINTLSLITSEKGEPWTPSSVMEVNMKSPSESLISSGLCSFKIISLNLIINTKIRQKIVLDLPSITPTRS